MNRFAANDSATTESDNESNLAVKEIQTQVRALYPDNYQDLTAEYDKEIRYLSGILGRSERILALTSPPMESSRRLVFCTSQRVLFLSKDTGFGPALVGRF